jgi:acetyl esterase/lipase
MQNRMILKGLILVTSLFVFAANSFGNDHIDADVVYGHKDGMALVYDVIKPVNPNGAAIVYMVSGGWYSRWAPPENRVEQFAYLLDAGFTVIPVHHGSAPRYVVPEAYSDVSRAIRHIKMHGEAHGIDADRIGVIGGSAGGHLSLMLGLNSDRRI